MRVRPAMTVLAVALGLLSAPGLAAAKKPTKKPPPKPKGPTAAQIRAAVRNASRSPDLWATINVCTSSPTNDLVGIRGQMPTLGFATTLEMNVSLSYWNYTDTAFEAVGATGSDILGKGTHGIHQGGVSFPISPPGMGTQYLVRGTVTFEWKIGTKLIARLTRNTGHGYPNVAFSNPPGFSAGTCTLT